MARKNVMKGLMEGTDPPAPSSPRPRYAKGAVGAVSKSIADLKTRAIVDLDPHLIDPGGLEDRLEHDEEDHRVLMESLKDHGQQVPVLVRPNVDDPERFQIVYGRRRVLALRDLGLPVKAMIRDLDDDALVVAQGQENSVRKELSFVEKANFARQMVEAGYARKIVCDALNIDKTVISRMLSLFDTLPLDLVRQVGSAHAIGRDRWLALARLWESETADLATAEAMILASGATGSDARFEAVYDWLTRRVEDAKTPALPPKTIYGDHEEPLAIVKRGTRSLDLSFRTKGSGGFENWLVNNLADIHRQWKTTTGGDDPEQEQ